MSNMVGVSTQYDVIKGKVISFIIFFLDNHDSLTPNKMSVKKESPHNIVAIFSTQFRRTSLKLIVI